MTCDYKIISAITQLFQIQCHLVQQCQKDKVTTTHHSEMTYHNTHIIQLTITHITRFSV